MSLTLATAYLNGEYLPIEKAAISPLDRGFLFGDAIYEVVPVHDGEPSLKDAHLARLERNLEALRISNPHTRVQWSALIEELASRNGGGNLAIYIQVSRGADSGRDHVFPEQVTPTVFAMANTLEKSNYTEGVAAITLPDERWGRCDIKATALLANVLARQKAQESGAIDAILICDGAITEGAVSSVILVENGELIRRPPGSEVLPGTTTDHVFDTGRALGLVCRDEIISEERLFAADEVWLAGATKGLAPVIRIDDQTVGSGVPGPVWKKVAANIEV